MKPASSGLGVEADAQKFGVILTGVEAVQGDVFRK